jgi:carbon monoxide dehydrogenase subunit G
MPFTFTGEFVVARRPEEVYDFLADPNRFCPLLPDFEEMTVTDPSHFTVNLKVGISHIRGTATVKMVLEEAERPQRARYSGKGRVAGGNVDIGAGFELAAVAGGTCVRWKGTAQVFGSLTSLAGGLLEPLAKKSVQKLIDGLQKALA